MCVELMTGTAWVNYSDNLSVVESPEWTRATAEAHVFGETAPLTVTGKHDPVDVTIRGIWAEGTADAFYVVYAQYTTPCSGMVAVRWAPAGCATSSDAFYTSTTNSTVSALTFPGGDSGSPDVLMWEFTIHSPDITRAAWA
jgi:hypothetical protein